MNPTTHPTHPAGPLPATPEGAVHPAVRVGHVHLQVADLDRAIAFYRDALGLAVTADARQVGVPMVLLAAGDYHHHIGLNTFESTGAALVPPRHTGLYHIGLVYPDRRELARAIRRLLDRGVPLDHGSDHGATVSVYLTDPDGNGVELYYDRPRQHWHDPDGHPVLKAERFDPHELTPDHDPTPHAKGADPMSLIFKRLSSPAMLVAVAALTVALGGVGYAAAVLPANSVGTKQLPGRRSPTARSPAMPWPRPTCATAHYPPATSPQASSSPAPRARKGPKVTPARPAPKGPRATPDRRARRATRAPPAIKACRGRPARRACPPTRSSPPKPVRPGLRSRAC